MRKMGVVVIHEALLLLDSLISTIHFMEIHSSDGMMKMVLCWTDYQVQQ
jgi:hypothetical protein